MVKVCWSQRLDQLIERQDSQKKIQQTAPVSLLFSRIGASVSLLCGCW